MARSAKRPLTVHTIAEQPGVGDCEFAEFLPPPPSTVAGASEAMVVEAVPLLLRLTRGDRDLSCEVFVVPPVYFRGSPQRMSRTRAGDA